MPGRQQPNLDQDASPGLNHPVSPNAALAADLHLADGSRWNFISGDDASSLIVDHLAKTMRLRPDIQGTPRRFFISVASGNQIPCPYPWIFSDTQDQYHAVCILPTANSEDMLALQMMRIGLVIVQETQARGGFLIHGALAEHRDSGVILAGAAGKGKTTASRRLPHTWRSLCDDSTLVVRDLQGRYHAHPWPTWSDFMFGGPGGSWEVEHSVPLRGILFLEQSSEDAIEAMASGEAVCRMVRVAEEAAGNISPLAEKNEIRYIRLQRFQNICDLALAVLCYRLPLSLEGHFWKGIERVLYGQGDHAS
jgi:SynChlorMet cassette protein ScmC